MKQFKAGIVGGAGYAGGESLRLLLGHPSIDLHFVTSKSQMGKKVSDVHMDLRGWTDLEFSAPKLNEVDVLFLCGGHGFSKDFLASNEVPSEVVIIDLSRDFRLKEDAQDFVYGLCELNKADIKSGKKIANPGCFATCIQLGLLPLAKHGKLNSDVHITAITGSTGAGQKPVATTHNSWRNNNISIYKPFTHQHLGEIKQSVSQLQSGFSHDMNFIPMRGSFTRGIFSSVYFKTDLSIEAAWSLFEDYYKDSPFVHLSKEAISVKEVVNTNNAFIHLSKFEDKLRIESVIDNLLKGAAGQAVQNMNLVLGLPEQEGLFLKGSAF